MKKYITRFVNGVRIVVGIAKKKGKSKLATFHSRKQITPNKKMNESKKYFSYEGTTYVYSPRERRAKRLPRDLEYLLSKARLNFANPNAYENYANLIRKHASNSPISKAEEKLLHIFTKNRSYMADRRNMIRNGTREWVAFQLKKPSTYKVSSNGQLIKIKPTPFMPGHSRLNSHFVFKPAPPARPHLLNAILEESGNNKVWQEHY